MNRALVVWQWTDGKRGHERQCEGLLEALADRTPLEHHRLPVPTSPLTRLIDVVRGVLATWRHLPAPHLVLGAGRACVLPMLATRRARGGRTVYLMRPQLPTACFDLCIVPRHDGLRAGPHVEISEGPLNPMRAGAERDATLGVVLVGGPSGHHGWHTEGLLAQLAALLRHAPRMHWVVSDSRRSPPDLERALAAYPGIEFHSHRDTPVDWLPGLLARAAEVWVSADSVSMIYEALSAGARRGTGGAGAAQRSHYRDRGRSACARPRHEAVRRGFVAEPRAAVAARSRSFRRSHPRALAAGGHAVMTRRLTVMQLLPQLDVGGVERGTLQIAEALVAAGHRALVVSAGGRLVPELEAGGAEHLTLAIGEKRLSTLRLIGKLRGLILEHGVDVVHARSRLPAWIGYLALRGLPPSQRPAWVTTVHGPYSVNRYSRIMVSGTRVIAISDFIRDYVTRNYAEVSPTRITVVPRGVDRALYRHDFEPDATWMAAWRAQYGALAGRALLILPARLTRWKGQLDFIEMMALLRRRGLAVHGLIAGAAHPRKRAFEDELRARVAALGLNDDVSFLGQRGDLRELLAISTIACSLTTEPEAFGRTTIEALSVGTPVVGYDYGGTAEILSHCFPHGLVPKGDVGAAADRVAALLADPQPVPREHPYTVEALQRATLAVYAEVASQGRA
ncbi:MAG: mitochondrial fission ELM1 family protein [Proteobacteria bacterium]|nr:mitochondrial fission ELM1 family protein [Pseudomonadota bacterium]